MKILQFYTSTSARDAERVNSWNGLLCPDWKMLPFQIQRPATNSTGLETAVLVDCAGATTSILADLQMDVNERTTYDFLTYNGEAFSAWMDYGVYYIEATDATRTWYSEWIDVRNIQPTVLTSWTATGFAGFTVMTTGSHEDVGIFEANASAPTGTALSNSFAVRTGEMFYLSTNYSILTAPVGLTFDIVSAGGTAIANQISIATSSTVQTNTFIVRATDSAAQLKMEISTGRYSSKILSLRRYAGDGSYVFSRFTNSKDIQGTTTLAYELTPERESILYSSGFEQQIYMETYLNNPQHEPVEIGEEKNGVFIAEKIVDKYVYNVVSYASRATFNAMRILPLHDNIQIFDEIGNRYRPDQGNVRVGVEWNTFDTHTLRIEFNEDNPVWTNNADNIV